MGRGLWGGASPHTRRSLCCVTKQARRPLALLRRQFQIYFFYKAKNIFRLMVCENVKKPLNVESNNSAVTTWRWRCKLFKSLCNWVNSIDHCSNSPLFCSLLNTQDVQTNSRKWNITTIDYSVSAWSISAGRHFSFWSWVHAISRSLRP